MKFKIILLLGSLLTGGISASPNKCCNGVRCAADAGKQTTISPVKTVVMMIDEAELMPLHYFLRNF
ncbi:MAG TPA: hypothetical protein VM187_09675 [Niastella sp.]|nr:hypothetical protein [Niastella sp.]